MSEVSEQRLRFLQVQIDRFSTVDIRSNFCFSLFFTPHRTQNTLSDMQEEKRRTNVSKNTLLTYSRSGSVIVALPAPAPLPNIDEELPSTD